MQQSDVSDLDQLVKLVDGLSDEVIAAAELAAADLRIEGEMPVEVALCTLRRGVSARSVMDRVAQDAARIQVLREAEYRHMQSGLGMAHVSVLFDEKKEIVSARIDRLADELVDVCTAHREQLFAGFRLTGATAGALPDGVEAVRVCQANPIRRTCWTGTTSQWFEVIEVDHVQHALDAGCEQLPGLRNLDAAEAAGAVTDDRWVVLMASKEATGELPAHVLEHAYEVQANRAFVMLAGAQTPRELDIVAAPAA